MRGLSIVVSGLRDNGGSMRTIAIIETEIRIMQGWHDNAVSDLDDAKARVEITRRALAELQAELAELRDGLRRGLALGL